MSEHPNSAKFHKILADLGTLHNQKQRDYGRDNDPFANVRASEEWGVPAWVGAMVRLNDKVRRLQTFALKGTLANEGVEDSLKDIAVYAVIAMVLFQEQHDSNKDFDFYSAMSAGQKVCYQHKVVLTTTDYCPGCLAGGYYETTGEEK